MKEIRFLKDLPCKLCNSNKGVINLLGGDIYYDKDGNRYAYLTFENLLQSPLFFFQASVKEYSGEGKLIKENELIIPYLYAPRGEFVNELPLEIDNETEALELLIVKATFDTQNFIDDKMVAFKEQDYVEKPSRAPAKKWDSKSTLTFVDAGEQVVRTQEKVVVNENGEQVTVTETVTEQPAQSLTYGTFTKKGRAFRFVILGVMAVIAIAAIIGFILFINLFSASMTGYY